MAKKAIKPNIVRGGIGIPVPGKTNYYYMKGRKHKDGGIDIGSNPRTGLEVEDGEVIHLTDNNIKVFSSVPFLNGQSPAEKVMGGENPNKVFKQQEDFKDRNKLNDDGTKKAKYGKKALMGTEEESNVPTREEYITQRLEEIRNSALDKSRNRTLPKSPLILNGETEEEYNTKRKSFIENVAKLEDRLKSLEQQKALGFFNDEQIKNTKENIQIYKDWLSKPYEKYKKGASCIYTATDNYGREYLVSGNQTFASNPAKYGFKKIKRTNIQPGDLVQDVSQGYPSHAMIYNGKNQKGVDTFNYSKGGDSEGDIVKGGTYKQNVPLDVFRFVGTAKDSVRFNMDYDKLYNKKAMGGKLNKPVTVTVNGKTKVVYSPSTGGTRSEAEGNRNKGQLGLLQPINKYNSLLQQPVTTQYKPTITYNPNRNYNQNSNNLLNTKDIISLSGNLLGSVLTAGLNARNIDKLNNPIAPIPKRATKLKTKINISPLMSSIINSEKNSIRDIDANTASSRVALARKNKIRSASIDRISNIFREKLIGENELINKDIINQQNIRNDNISAYNKYLSEDVKFTNDKQTLKSENVTSLINNVNSSIQNVISNLDKRNKDKNTTIAIMAANPNVNPKYLRDLGFDGITNKMISDWEKANKK